ncbi:MAG: hypothetical protein K6D03_10830 [Solobacterium sp.]|nr:hypothetical protein [Solobacterium sp.]
MRTAGKVIRVLCISGTLCLASCNETADMSAVSSMQMEQLNSQLVLHMPDDGWRTTYEIFVPSFYDSDSDGIGDLKGITEKLDYLNDGIEMTFDDPAYSQIWLTPICEAVSYHKYDVTDYLAVDDDFGSMADFENLVQECHSRGIRVIFDLVANHTSDRHPWFQEAVSYIKSLPEGKEPDASECRYVDYYNFAKKGGNGFEKIQGTDWFYEARFWGGMPDLNLDSEQVRDEIREVIRFWSEKGADGFRLDAVTSYYTGDTEKSAAFTGWIKQTALQYNPDCYVVGEGWTDQRIYAQYYADGIDSMFDFAFAGQDGIITRVVRGNEPASAFAKALENEEALYSSYSSTYINAPFYTNHDMARSTGYYAGDDGSRTKLAGALNLLMSGNAFVYYGEELGMKGAGKDENKRAPMYWSADADAQGMCDGPPAMDSVAMKFPSYEEQKDDPYSIFNYYRNAVRIRNAFPVIAKGRTAAQDISTDKVCAMIRYEENGEDTPVYILINTSEENQTADVGYMNEELVLSAVLLTGEQPVVFENNKVQLPPFAVAVLTGR